MIFVDIETIILMFKTTYAHSYLRGDEVARILEVRYGQEKQKSAIDAKDSEVD
jgi:hypothetical protein